MSSVLATPVAVGSLMAWRYHKSTEHCADWLFSHPLDVIPKGYKASPLILLWLESIGVGNSSCPVYPMLVYQDGNCSRDRWLTTPNVTDLLLDNVASSHIYRTFP